MRFRHSMSKINLDVALQMEKEFREAKGMPNDLMPQARMDTIDKRRRTLYGDSGIFDCINLVHMIANLEGLYSTPQNTHFVEPSNLSILTRFDRGHQYQWIHTRTTGRPILVKLQ